MRISSLPAVLLLLVAVALFGGCGTDTLATPTDCVIDNDCDRGQACVDGACTASSTLDTTPDGSADTEGSADTSSADAEGSADTSFADTEGSADTTVEDTTPVDTTPVDTTPPAPTWSFVITAPVERDAFRTSSTITLTGQMTGEGIDFSTFDIAIASSINGSLGVIHPDSVGAFTLPLIGLRPGRHALSVRVVAPDGIERTLSVNFGVCPDDTTLDFAADLDPTQWLVLGDAVRDPSGWLELTGLAQSRAGSIFYLGDILAEGDVEINLRVSTGQCNPPGPCSVGQEGADGFAMSIFSVPTVEELTAVVADGAPGGGLGYGVSGPYGPRVVDAFHVEFDTYFNRVNGAELHTDPTSLPHVAVTLNGNPADHILWTEVPALENNQWHDVTLAVLGSHVSVMFDGAMIIDSDVAGLSFKGGYIGFTGSTGYYYNYHRIDDLQVVQACNY